MFIKPQASPAVLAA